jgi:hypothetical protein
MLYNVLFVKTIEYNKKILDILTKYKNIHFTYVCHFEYINVSEFDAVFCHNSHADIKKYPNTTFIFGPDLCVFPHQMNISQFIGPNTIYVQPSQWVIDYWKLYPPCNNLKMKQLPFGIDTDLFCPDASIQKNDTVFIYFKNRETEELEHIINFLNKYGIPFHIFDYLQGYQETDYVDFLKSSKYGIWLGEHESQGFELEEALSCNVPLLVWDVTSMNQKCGYNYPDIKATSIPYWDSSCGEVFYKSEELENTFVTFLSKLDSYSPRDYIVNNLSIDVCEKLFIDAISNI